MDFLTPIVSDFLTRYSATCHMINVKYSYFGSNLISSVKSFQTNLFSPFYEQVPVTNISILMSMWVNDEKLELLNLVQGFIVLVMIPPQDDLDHRQSFCADYRRGFGQFHQGDMSSSEQAHFVTFQYLHFHKMITVPEKHSVLNNL